MTKRSMFKRGDAITTNEMREMHGPRYARYVPRGPFKVTQVIKTEHRSGGYRIIANAAKKGVVVSWEMFYAPSKGKRGGKTTYAFHGPLMVIDPERQKENLEKGRKLTKRRGRNTASKGAPSLSKVMPSGSRRAKVLLTLSQFDGDDL